MSRGPKRNRVYFLSVLVSLDKPRLARLACAAGRAWIFDAVWRKPVLWCAWTMYLPEPGMLDVCADKGPGYEFKI